MSTSLNNDSMMPKRHIPIQERRAYIPEWAEPVDESKPLLDEDGTPTGFTVGDVLPERRFAITPEGRIRDQREFEDLYRRYISMKCLPNGNVISIAAVNRDFNPQFESCPNARRWVMVEMDPAGRPQPLGFGRSAKKAARVRGFFNSDGDPVPLSDLPPILAFKANLALQQMEKQKRIKEISEAAYDLRVKKILDDLGMTMDDFQDGIAAFPEGFENVMVTEDDLRRIEDMVAREHNRGAEPEAGTRIEVGGTLDDAMAGSSPPPAPPAMEEKPERKAPEPTFRADPVDSLCGKSCKGMRGKLAHERKCKKCEEIRAGSVDVTEGG